MKCILSVNKIVVDEILEKGRVEAITDYNNPYSKQAYKTLAKQSKMENFFFAFELNNSNMESIVANMPENDCVIIVSVPRTENIFKMPYYDFSDLIYYYDNASIEELESHGYKTIEIIINKCMGGNLGANNELVQVNFSNIQKEWVYQTYNYADFNGITDVYKSNLGESGNGIKGSSHFMLQQ